MALERELETYRRRVASLLPDKAGKFVVVHQDEITGDWDTYPDALRARYEQFGLEPFLVKRVEAVEQVQYITRDVELPCHT